jgi:GNAT superfamily N-acetyltransferase
METAFRYINADEELKARIAQEWGEKPARHMHISDGFSVVAFYDEMPVGLISVYWRELPPPVEGTFDGYIDILEVDKEFRRRGIATQLIKMATERARVRGAHQMHSWSSIDKTEAIPMWKALGFGLCPAVTYPKGQKVEGYFVARPL